MYNIYLSINNRQEEIQIPVLPSTFGIGSEYQNERIETVTDEEIMHIGNRKLSTIAFSSFFPDNDYHFLRSRDMYGWDYIKTIQSWREKKIPIRLVITNTNINMPVVITGFEYTVQDGTGDIYYTLQFEEYKFISIQSLTSVAIAKPKPVVSESKTKTKTISKSKTKAKEKLSTIKSKSAENLDVKLEKIGVKEVKQDGTVTYNAESLISEMQIAKDLIINGKPKKEEPKWFEGASTNRYTGYGGGGKPALLVFK